jgi:hypothetical protein
LRNWDRKNADETMQKKQSHGGVQGYLGGGEKLHSLRIP